MAELRRYPDPIVDRGFNHRPGHRPKEMASRRDGRRHHGVIGNA